MKKRLYQFLIVFIFLISFCSVLKPEASFKVFSHMRPNVYSLFYFTPKEDQIFLDINHNNFQKLAYHRELALEEGVIKKERKEYVKAKIRFRNQSYKVKIRLKGDWTDHLEENAWSFRVKTSGQNSFLNMKNFSLQHPTRRGGLLEWIWHKALEKEGLITPKYEFFELIVNGKSWGIYNLEEHFEKQIVERNKFREGPIIKFDETLYWEYTDQHSKKELIQHSLIASFKSERTLLNPSLKSNFLQAYNKLNGFIKGQLEIDQVFDTDKLATSLAITTLMGAHHSLIFHNTRYYYNPITTLLEPISFDGNAHRIPDFWNPIAQTKGVDWTKKMLENKEFEQLFLKKLHFFSEDLYLDQFFSKIEPELKKNQKKLQTIYAKYELDKKNIYSNFKKIKELLKK